MPDDKNINTPDDPKGKQDEPKVQIDDPKGSPTEPKEDLTGLINKRDELLGETKKLKAKLKKFEDDQAKKDKDKLLEDGKLKELIDKQTKQIETLQSEVTKRDRKETLRKLAIENNFDTNYLKLLEDHVKFTETNEIENGAELIKMAKEKFPIAFTDNQSNPSFQSGSSPKGYSPTKKTTYTIEDLKSITPEQWEAMDPAVKNSLKQSLYDQVRGG
jgi:hypothetical protein